jgi:hypothetical protein
VAGSIRSIEKCNDIGNGTRDLLACSIVPQQTTPPRAPYVYHSECILHLCILLSLLF